jgi:predicted PurR-regulated permease PerM
MSEIKFWRGVAIVLGFLSFVWLLVQVWSVVVPFFLGIALSYLIYPVVDRLVGIGLRQDRVVLVLYVVLLSIGAFLVAFLLPNLILQTRTVAGDLPSYAKTLDQAVLGVNEWIRLNLERILGARAGGFQIPFHAEAFLDKVFSALPNKLINVAHIGLWLLIVPFVSFFGLSQGRRGIDFLFQITPSEYVESLLGLLAEINATLGGYLRGLVLESLCVGLATLIGLWAMGVEGFVFLGVLTGLLNIVPFLAPIVGGSLALLAGVFQGASSSVLLGIVLLYIGIRMVDDFILIPFIIGHSVQLHPVLMLFAVLAGFEMGGFLGLLVAIPGAAVIKVILTVLMRTREERLTLRLNHVHI